MPRQNWETEAAADERARRDAVLRPSLGERGELRQVLRAVQLPVVVLAAGPFAAALVLHWNAVRQAARQAVDDFYFELGDWWEVDGVHNEAPASFPTLELIETLLCQRVLRRLADLSAETRQELVCRLRAMSRRGATVLDADAILTRFLERVEPSSTGLTAVDILAMLAIVPPEEWVYEIAGHAQRSADRYATVQARVMGTRLGFDIALEMAVRPPSSGDDREEVARMRDLLAALSPEERDHIVGYLRGLTLQQQAAADGGSIATAHRRRIQIFYDLRMKYHRTPHRSNHDDSR